MDSNAGQRFITDNCEGEWEQPRMGTDGERVEPRITLIDARRRRASERGACAASCSDRAGYPALLTSFI